VAKAGDASFGRLLLAPVLVMGAALALLAIDTETGLVPLVRLQDRVQGIRARVAGLEAERDALRARVRLLRSDDFTVEAVAREQLGMVRPGEIVIRWDD
jgi:cell division protein FtsB